TVTLVGIGTDQDGSISKYQWTKISGPSATILDADKASLKLTNLVEGVYTFKLTVTDNKNASASDEVKVTVNPAPEPENLAPIADAGEDKTLTLPENNTTLKGYAEDKDGEIITYLWTKVSGPEVTMTDRDKLNLTLDNLVAGIYTFRLTVTDNEGETAFDEVKVTVKEDQASPTNQSPTAHAGGDKTLTLPENTITLVGSGEDKDGEITSYLWSKLSGPEATLQDANKPSLTLKDLVAGTYIFRLTVSDNASATASDEVKLTDHPAPEPKPENKAPIAHAGDDKTLVLPKNSIILNGSGEDEDGEIVAYHWTKVSGPDVVLIGMDKSDLNLSGLQEGEYLFKLTVTDNNGAMASSEARLIVKPAPNQAPIANAGKDKILTLPDNSTTVEGTATDADGSITTYLWTKTSGPQVKMVDADKPVLSLINLVEGTYDFTLTVTDDRGATATDEVRITVKPAPNLPPTANAGKDVVITLPNNSTKLKGTGTDSDGHIVGYQWSKVSGPTASLEDAYTATLNLSNLVSGVYTFRLTVTDDRGAKASDEVKVTVNTPPSANAGRDKTLTLPENSTYLSGAGSDTDGTI